MPETTKNVTKVVYGGKVLIDLTGDTVTPGTLLTGTTAHDKSGAAITGTMEASEVVNAQERSVVPSVEEQVVLPEEGYDCLSKVTVAAIPYAESENDAGGVTVTIAG